jgi:hypothetical protein
MAQSCWLSCKSGALVKTCAQIAKQENYTKQLTTHHRQHIMNLAVAVTNKNLKQQQVQHGAKLTHQ